MPRRSKPRRESLGAFGDPLLDANPVAILDLHRFTAAEAEGAVRNFLLSWQRRAPGSLVHLVTGKGKGSAGPAVLKPRVRRMLEDELNAVVKQWSRDIDDGGFLVLLR
jgi:DNA-nicking Smr family endonuclease